MVPAVADEDVKIPMAPEGRRRNIVITGSNSGIGKDAACKLAAGGYNVFLACRTMEKAMEARRSVVEEVNALSSRTKRGPGEVTALECDLSSLSSIRKFADEWNKSGRPIDVLVLNAGVALNTGARPPPPRTKDGFEITVGTNHLGHFYLTQLLLDAVEKSPEAPRIVVTASQVHDPSSPGGNVGSKATLGDMQGLAAGIEWEMVDGGGWDADKAYKDSKLCNVLFTRELQRRLQEKGSRVSCNCFSPGLITRTGLFRDQGGFFLSAFDFIVNNVAKVAETVSFGGDCLVTMAVSESLEGKRGVFWSNSKPGKHTFEEVEVSAEAKDAEKGKRLWELSEQAITLALKKQQA
uniref:Protochlorophyllide reductase n=1 Tax=Hanusia phi TaxID=3032 RepID=A0A7S0HJM0_9CRYP